MPSTYEDRDRKIVPRWREFATTGVLRELKPHKVSQPEAGIPEASFPAKLRDWREKQTISYAADLLSCAIVLRKGSEVQEAAEAILAQEDTGFMGAKRLAIHVLGRPTAIENQSSGPRSFAVMNLRQKVHAARLTLQDHPRDAFLWVDLARHYETLGFPIQAGLAMRMGLRLAPDNRFVLRAAARLYVHQNDHKYAHRLLKENAGVRSDPWILAAEIAVASAAHRSSTNIKTARRILSASRFSPLHVSELASAVGTLELEAGNRKRGRKLVQLSLVDPTENSIAQAAWLDRHLGVRELDPKITAVVPHAYEARAWRSYLEGKWNDTFDSALKWLQDQPFSRRPAVLGSYVATVPLAEYEKGAEIAQLGLVANPRDFTLLNNYSFALAQSGSERKSREEFEKIDPSGLCDAEGITWRATKGLLAYRAGDAIKGRQLYQEALTRAKKANDDRRWSVAFLFFVMEELRTQTREAQTYYAQAIEQCENLPYPEITPLLARVRSLESAQGKD